jgi:hypothetical protein
MVPNALMTIPAAVMPAAIALGGPASAAASGEALPDHLSSCEIGSPRLGSVPPSAACEAIYRDGQCLGVAGREDDPATPWHDPVPVLYELTESGRSDASL